MERTLLFGWGRGRTAVVRAEVPSGSAVGALVQACAQAVGAELRGDLAIWRRTTSGASSVLVPGVSIEGAGIRSGDLLQLRPATDPRPTAETPSPGADLEVVAVGGPLSGSRTRLRFGSNPMPAAGAPGSHKGRLPALEVGEDGEVCVVPGGTAERIEVDGGPVGRAAMPVPPGAWLRWGASVLTVRAVTRPSPETTPDTAVRPPRVGEPARPGPFDVPEAPARAPRSSVPLGVVVAPALVAVAVALVTRNPVYLLFGALAPLIGGWRLVADQRSGRRTFKAASRRYRFELARARSDLSATHAAVLRARRAAMPDVASLVGRAVRNRPTAWERRPGDGDFLVVRVGIGNVVSILTVVPHGRPAGADAEALVAEHRLDMCVPVTVDLDTGAQLGVAGAGSDRRAVARMIALQVGVLHAPEEVGLAIVAPDHDRGGWDWASFLPHATVIDAEAVAAHAAAWRDGATQRRLLVVVDGEPPAPLMAALLESAGAGVSIVWCAVTRERLPRTCGHVLVVDSPLQARLTGEGADAVELLPDHAGEADCLAAARALAARTDGAAALTGGLPQVVGLREALGSVIGADPTDPDAITSLWSADGPPRMRCVIGRGGGGPVCADLDTDGPHALVVGTTGSGKSELFTTVLASLAVGVPPGRLGFLLVDFKGGAAFDRLAALPHTAGVVTDLDGALAHRVLVSLEAELRRRMRLLRELAVPDVATCERRQAAAAPARLVVVVDEFAALSREVPGFVDGLVDVARRGRSLGVHLLVGTQQPDANTAKLADNTNLRVCLRVQDAGVSRDVVGVGDAARFPRELRGRAIVARGHGDAVEVQTAWAGCAASRSDRLQVRVLAPGAVTAPGVTAGGGPGSGRSELDEVVDAVVEAWQGLGGETRPHRVWVPPPASTLRLADLEPGDAGAPVVGVADEAHLQRLSPMPLDLGAWGSLLVAGRSGSGRTTLLRTVAAALARTGGGGEVALYGVDCADGGLACITALPQCAAVVAGAEAERIDRLFAVLSGELSRRAADPTRRLPAITLLLDGIGAFAAAHEDWTGGQVATLRRLCEDGRRLGLHVVAAGDLVSVPGRVRDSFGTVVELVGPGDAVGPGDVRWRVATAGELLDVGGGEPAQVPSIEALPAEVARSGLAATGTGGPPLGVVGDTMETVWCDLERVPLFLVVGPMRSGRSTALATLASGICEDDPSARLVLLAPRRGPLRDLGCWDEVAVGPDACAGVASTLAADVRAGADAGGVGPAGGGRLVVVVDDAEILSDGLVATALDEVARSCWDAGAWFLAAAESHAAARSFGWLMQLRVSRHGLVLQADPDIDSEVFRVRLPRRRGYANLPGRGELVGGDVIRLVQVAH